MFISQIGYVDCRSSFYENRNANNHCQSNTSAMASNLSNQNPNSFLKTKTGINKIQIVKIQREQMVNRVSSSFSKVGHLAKYLSRLNDISSKMKISLSLAGNMYEAAL